MLISLNQRMSFLSLVSVMAVSFCYRIVYRHAGWLCLFLYSTKKKMLSIWKKWSTKGTLISIKGMPRKLRLRAMNCDVGYGIDRF